MSFFNPTPIERLFSRRGSFIVYSKLPPEEQQLLGAPQFQVGQIVTVRNPWWWRDGSGNQIKSAVRCRVIESSGYFHRRGDGGGYSLDVREVDHPGAHGRSVQEQDVEGFVPNPLYPPA